MKAKQRTLKTKPSSGMLDSMDQKQSGTARTKRTNAKPVNVSLSYRKKLICSFTLDAEENSTSDLLDYAMGVFRNTIKDNANVLGVECGNSQLDFYLQCPRRSLDVFKGNIALTPFLESIEKGINRYRFLKVIGVGGFSKVYLARSKRDGRFYAIKLLEKRKVIESKKTRILMNQRNILSRVNHPSILKLYECFQTHLFFCFVLEYCPGGELFYALSQTRKFSQQEIRFYACELLDTLNYLHKKSILYRDLKPQNILLDAEGHIKLIDFGVSKPNVSKEMVCTSFCGSPPYMPPEIVKKEGHSFPVDFYCLGALMFELACGYPPFDAENENQIFYAILHNEVQYPEFIGKTFKSLLKGLLHKDPKERLGSKGGAEEILCHKFFQTAALGEILGRKSVPPIIPRVNALNVCVSNVVTEFIDLQKKLEIELELECNTYQKTLPSFQFVNYNLKPMRPETRRQDQSKEQYFTIDPVKDMKKDRNKCIKKSLTKPQLNRYNSVRNMSGQSNSRSKSRSKSKSNSRNNSIKKGKDIRESKDIKNVKNVKNSSKERKVFFGYYFDEKLKDPSRDSSKELLTQFSMTNISGHVYFS